MLHYNFLQDLFSLNFQIIIRKFILKKVLFHKILFLISLSKNSKIKA